jgi:hypothetical protein
MNWLDGQLLAVTQMILGRGDEPGKGLARLDGSDAAFKVSFLGVFIILLLDLTIIDFINASNDAEIGRLVGVVGYVVAYICAYCTGFFALVLICRRPPLDARFKAAVTASNWGTLIFGAVFWPLTLILVALPGESSARFALMAIFFGLTLFMILGSARILRDTLHLRLGLCIGLCIAIYVGSSFIYEGVMGSFGLLGR